MPKNTRRAGKVMQALGELRAFGADVDRVDGAAAARLGLNRTDLRVMELLNRNGALSASELATATELTTAAVTTVMDRLESRNLAVRVHDPGDRRRVLVEPTQLATQMSDEMFGGLLDGVRRVLTGYSETELDTIVGFLEAVRTVFSNELAALRTRRHVMEPPVRDVSTEQC